MSHSKTGWNGNLEASNLFMVFLPFFCLFGLFLSQGFPFKADCLFILQTSPQVTSSCYSFKNHHV